ncbi:hypothetical protein Tsubulata_008937 [Turnera subulata]|uniref:C3H1-type domain-containing protein n=1 Tax=Turnera subulata TaxID=218843 RepID=A0A9Q0EZF7_9ROSI|nr:hypothetical protein Tsubulata_008937 [Turnera subulata]
MEKTASPPSDPITVVSPETKQSPPPLPSSPPPDYPANHQFASTFTSLYHSIFPPKTSPLPTSLSLTPSTSSPSSATTATAASSAHDMATEHRLHQARLILEYQELCDHYERSLSRLQALTEELQVLREENADLRLANGELINILSLSSIQSPLTGNCNAAVSDFGPAAVVEPIRLERPRNADRVSLPKSISVRSSGYTKPNQTVAGGNAGAINKGISTRPRLASQLHQLVSEPVQQKVYVAGGGGKRPDDAGAVELDVYNQGMWKTELCNKWQERGTCPYGDHCQFAHGITELRPVIRHPRYKTQACRMVLAGDICPYGHRCHFRHSLSEQERLLLGPR